MAKPRIRNSFAASLFVAVIFAGGPAAANLISDRFDGVYVGAASLERDLSSESCAPKLPLVRLEIRNGILRAYDENGRQIVKGFVTGAGFFTSDYIFANGETTLFEGMVDSRGRFTGGIVYGACAWVVELSKSPR